MPKVRNVLRKTVRRPFMLSTVSWNDMADESLVYCISDGHGWDVVLGASLSKKEKSIPTIGTHHLHQAR